MYFAKLTPENWCVCNMCNIFCNIHSQKPCCNCIVVLTTITWQMWYFSFYVTKCMINDVIVHIVLSITMRSAIYLLRFGHQWVCSPYIPGGGRGPRKNCRTIVSSMEHGFLKAYNAMLEKSKRSVNKKKLS